MMKLGMVLVILCLAAQVQAQELFVDCKNAVNDKAYAPLQKFFHDKDESNLEGFYCLRLSRTNFIYIDGVFFNYCTQGRNGTMTCEQEGNSFLRGMSPVEQVATSKGKRFVLLETSDLHGGVFDSSSFIFYMVPLSENPRGYVLFRVPGIGAYNGSYSDSGKVCSHLGRKSVARVPVGKGYRVSDPGDGGIIFTFEEDHIPCANQKAKTRVTVELRWQDGKFVVNEWGESPQ